MSNIGLEKRIVTAIRLYCENKDSMHVPPSDLDIDVVLLDCFESIVDLKQQLAEVHASRESLLAYKDKLENPDYVLVPREPTEGMMHVAIECFVAKDELDVVYKGMLEASQK